jgi:hypothetical protein
MTASSGKIFMAVFDWLEILLLYYIVIKKKDMIEEQVIKLLKENSIGKQTAVIESMNLGIYIWRKRVQVIKNFMDIEFNDLSEDEQKLVLSNVEKNQYIKSKSYQG